MSEISSYCMWLTVENTKVTQHRWVSNKTITVNYELVWFQEQLRAKESPTEWLQVEDNNYGTMDKVILWQLGWRSGTRYIVNNQDK
jgi:hypothetical protein